MVALGKTGCIGAKVAVFGQSVVFGQKWLYSSTSGCIRATDVVFGQKWLYSGKMFVFWQKWLYSGRVCILANWLFLSKSG